MTSLETRITQLRSTILATAIVLLAGIFFSASFASAEPLAAASDGPIEMTIEAPAIDTLAALDMRDDEYNSDYIFGMTKGVANSTWLPGFKVIFFVVTIPLDIALLPFAAIGGFF